jgi:hypothetical protein
MRGSSTAPSDCACSHSSRPSQGVCRLSGLSVSVGYPRRHHCAPGWRRDSKSAAPGQFRRFAVLRRRHLCRVASLSQRYRGQVVVTHAVGSTGTVPLRVRLLEVPSGIELPHVVVKGLGHSSLRGVLFTAREVGSDNVFVDIAIYAGIASDLEGLAISAILPKWQSDIPSVIHASRLRAGA